MTPLVRRDASVWPDTLLPLLTILFTKYHGRTCPQAVATAQQARVYREQSEAAALRHVATFACTAAQASALPQLTVNLKGAVVFDGDGRQVSNKRMAMQVLDCSRQASMGTDATAYCQVVITDPFA